MAQAITVPNILEMLSGEQLNISVDFTNVIATGDVVSSPVVTVTNSATNETVAAAIIGSPTVSNNVIINVTVNSSFLRKRTDYQTLFSCVATGGGTNKSISALLTIRVIY